MKKLFLSLATLGILFGAADVRCGLSQKKSLDFQQSLPLGKINDGDTIVKKVLTVFSGKKDEEILTLDKEEVKQIKDIQELKEKIEAQNNLVLKMFSAKRSVSDVDERRKIFDDNDFKKIEHEINNNITGLIDITTNGHADLKTKVDKIKKDINNSVFEEDFSKSLKELNRINQNKIDVCDLMISEIKISAPLIGTVSSVTDLQQKASDIVKDLEKKKDETTKKLEKSKFSGIFADFGMGALFGAISGTIFEGIKSYDNGEKSFSIKTLKIPSITTIAGGVMAGFYKLLRNIFKQSRIKQETTSIDQEYQTLLAGYKRFATILNANIDSFKEKQEEKKDGESNKKTEEEIKIENEKNDKKTNNETDSNK